MNDKIELTPKIIVAELDKYIIGQEDAKKAVAIALRHRWRRKQVTDPSLANDIVPKNILMVGATGVGKTEIARRLAKITNAPFIKVEATKFTEIGYVGKDIESIIRDLIEIAVNMVRQNMRKDVEEVAKQKAYHRIIAALTSEETPSDSVIEKFKPMLDSGQLDNDSIEIEIQDQPSSNMSNSFEIPGLPGARGAMINIGEILSRTIGNDKLKTVNVTVKEAYETILKEESDKIIDEDKIIQTAINITESDGIVFLDEIDKIAAKSSDRGEVSREGVQRDLLPLIEGTVVNTKYGSIKTDHILFIASGAFHIAKPSDLLPELQGRLPIKVDLDSLTKEDMQRILTEPTNSLIKQYQALLLAEHVTLEITEDAIEKIADIAQTLNKNIENIGARRLHHLLEKLLEEISYNADEYQNKTFKIDLDYVNDHLGNLIKEEDLSKFVL